MGRRLGSAPRGAALLTPAVDAWLAGRPALGATELRPAQAAAAVAVADSVCAGPVAGGRNCRPHSLRACKCVGCFTGGNTWWVYQDESNKERDARLPLRLGGGSLTCYDYRMIMAAALWLKYTYSRHKNHQPSLTMCETYTYMQLKHLESVVSFGLRCLPLGVTLQDDYMHNDKAILL